MNDRSEAHRVAARLQIFRVLRDTKWMIAVSILVSLVLYAPDQLREKGLETARTIATKGPVAVRLTKQIVQRGQDIDLANACQQEAYAFGLACATEDQKEGMKAFLEKRPARFTGR